MDQNIKSQDLIFIDTSGFSMWPFLKAGQKLVIKKVPLRDLRIGDIILYRVNNQLVCHRLVKKFANNGKYLLCVRADNSISPPELINEEMFQGKVAGILRNGKIINFNNFKLRFINRIIVIIAPLMVRVFKPCYFKFRQLCNLLKRKNKR